MNFPNKLSNIFIVLFGFLIGFILILPIFEVYLHFTVGSKGGKFLGVFTGKGIPIDNKEEIYRFKENKTLLLRFDQNMGWVFREGASNKDIHINSIGARSLKEYSLTQKDNKIRVAAFGDSFTFGAHVPDDQVWSHIIEDANPDIEVMNFGVLGYGTDQAYLRFLQKKDQLKGFINIFILGFLTENIARNLNRYRGWLIIDKKWGLPKPVYRLRSDQLELIPLPPGTIEHLMDIEWIETNLSQNDYFYPHFVQLKEEVLQSSPIYVLNFFRQLLFKNLFHYPKYLDLYHDEYALKLTSRIMEAFVKTVEDEPHALPLILIFPTFRDVIVSVIRDPSHRTLLQLLKDKGIPYLDLTPHMVEAFKEKPYRRLYQEGFAGHLSNRGNKVVADAVWSRIQELTNSSDRSH